MNVRIEHPARYYILYLLSQRRFHPQEIISDLLRQNMPVPQDEKRLSVFTQSIALAQQSLAFPPNYRPYDLTHRPTVEWLNKMRILDLWAREPHAMFATDLLDQPELRRELEVMLLGPLDFADIAKRLAILHRLDRDVMNVSTVRYFAHYYWNPEAVPSSKWPEYIGLIPSNLDYEVAYKAPRNQVGAALSVYVATKGAGGVPKETVMFRVARDTCFMEFLQVSATRFPGMQKATAMQSLVNALIASQEQVDMRRGGSAELLDELRRMETRFDPKRLTNVEELPLHNLLAAENKDKENAS